MGSPSTATWPELGGAATGRLARMPMAKMQSASAVQMHFFIVGPFFC
jgi:hypothetical protein